MRAKALRCLPNIRTSDILPRLLGTSTWHIAAGRRSYESYGSNRRSRILPRKLAWLWRKLVGAASCRESAPPFAQHRKNTCRSAPCARKRCGAYLTSVRAASCRDYWVHRPGTSRRDAAPTNLMAQTVGAAFCRESSHGYGENS